MSIPQTRLAENEGSCMPVCPVKLPSPCETALTAMLADVSPGGQYAEYRDTTYRDVAHPTGIIAPKIFPVSIMNDSANVLPIRNANWRNPAFDYQNQDGTTAYIEIQSDGLPAHRALDILERDGKRFVKPQYLEYTEDFIRYWNPAFARSLVVYHPEYPYYLWCINNSNFNDFDTLLTLTSTYAKARDLNLLNRTAADPFFVSNPSALPLMSNELTNYMPLAGFANLSIEEATYATIHCNNANFSNADLNSCARGKVLYANAATADKEWSFYRDFYRVKRNKMRDNARRSWILSNGYFDNRQIGITSGAVAHPMFADKTKRFNENSDALAMLPTDVDTVSVETLMEWRKATIADAGEYCGGCAAGFDLSAWLNALVVEKKLTQSLSLPSVTPLTFSKPFTRYFEDSLSLSYQWNTATNPNNIVFTVSTARGAQCEINLNKTAAISWDSIARFDCFKTAGASNNTFQIRAHTASDSVFDVTGSSSCMNFRSCGNTQVCDKTPAADDMAILMKYLFQSSRYRNSNLTLRGRRGRTPYLGEGLRERAPNAHLWKWRMKTISEGEKQLTAMLEVWDNTAPPNPLFDNQRAYLCPFTLTVLSPGFGLNQVADIIDIDRPTTATQCSVVDFILTARTTGGALFKIAGTSCYPVYDCCHQIKGPTTALCCLPVMPKLEFEPTCLREAEAVAENNRQRDAEDRLHVAADTFRTNLIRRCLSAVETFNAQYVDAVYQVTLMYYDRSGQLVKTIPPLGVRLLDATGIYRTRNARMDGNTYVPAHTIATTYRYNSFNQLVEKSSPDEGVSRICYDENGRAILSQDAAQRAANTAVYTLYDKIGRIIESGSRPYSGIIPSFQRYSDYLAATTGASGKTEIKRTRYDAMPSAGLALFATTPKKLRNRVAAIEAFDTPTTLSHATYFDYDALGNARQVVQHFAMLPVSTTGANVKRISYDYNPISGKVDRVWYQKNHSDQLIHWYQYDADGRMVLVQTGTNPNEPELLRETEARYYYYKHGPMARVELGSENVQGIDYAYTINGMLKAINSGNCKPEFDMGGDGLAESGRFFVPDVFGQSLNFFGGDYAPISAEAVQFYTLAGGELESGFAKPLYNGFIRSMVSTIPAIDATPMARGFRYDQTGRLERMQTISDAGALTSNVVSGAFTNAYGMQLSYDANGNIMRLVRKDQTGADIDNLTYAYNSGSNQLNHILDAVTAVGSIDISNQASDNYTYDLAGRLLRDGNKQMSWNSNGLIKEVRNAHGGNLHYGYDALNRRVIEKKNGIVTDFYVNDAQGNRIASYGLEAGSIVCRSLSLQGIGRLGEYMLNREAKVVSADSGNFYRGLKRYEIINHIGDVQVVISDKRSLYGDNARASVVSATDYYPFGMIMPGRKMGDDFYRYGFQGMECDDDWADDGNEYTTAFRQYDPRVGRWLSVDPMAMKYASISPYNAMFNNTLAFTDLSGADPYNDNPRLVRDEFERELAEMAEWGDDPIAGIEEESLAMLGEGPPDAIERLGIELDRLEGNNDPLAGMPFEVIETPPPPRVRHRRESSEGSSVTTPLTTGNFIYRRPDTEGTRETVHYIRARVPHTTLEILGYVGTAVDYISMGGEAMGEIADGALGAIGNTLGAVITGWSIYDDYNNPEISPEMFAARSSVRVVSYVAGMADIGVPGFGVASSTIIGSLVPETSSERETRLRERREFQDARSLEWMRNHRESLSPAMRRRYLRERY
jgi:RHS repeat-associated protein